MKKKLSDLACAHWPRRHFKGSKNERICAERELRKAERGAVLAKAWAKVGVTIS